MDSYECIYIFENDPLWVEALHYTYADYMDKVQIIEKYVSNRTNEKEIKIYDILKKYEILDSITIKMDVEGAEVEVLKGCEDTFLRSKNIILYVAAYHKPDAVNAITQCIRGFHYEFSQGYMINLWERPLKIPFLRKGMIRAGKGWESANKNIKSV